MMVSDNGARLISNAILVWQKEAGLSGTPSRRANRSKTVYTVNTANFPAIGNGGGRSLKRTRLRSNFPDNPEIQGNNTNLQGNTGDTFRITA